MSSVKKSAKTGMRPVLRSNLTPWFEWDRFMDDPFMGSPFWGFRRPNHLPATNIRETDKEYVVEMAAPGMKKKDFHIDLLENVLEIKAERAKETMKEEEDYTRKEYDYRNFCRAFTLPETVNPDGIKAEYEDGLLKVHIPKVPAARRKPVKEIAVG